MSTDAHFINRGGYWVSDKPHLLTLPAPIRLKRQIADDGSDLTLEVSQQYEIVEWESKFRIHTLKYTYQLANWDDGHEVLAYHWHPEHKVGYPHLHISYGAHTDRDDLLRAHFPTGRVALEDVIHFAIESFRIAPTKEDWAGILAESRERFRKFRTWA